MKGHVGDAHVRFAHISWYLVFKDGRDVENRSGVIGEVGIYLENWSGGPVTEAKPCCLMPPGHRRDGGHRVQLMKDSSVFMNDAATRVLFWPASEVRLGYREMM